MCQFGKPNEEAAMAEDTGRLAERLAKLEGLLEGMLPHLATKADV